MSDTDQLGPRVVERPSDIGATTVAVLDNPSPFLVDGGGLVQPPGCDWSLDWWIGADDRWYAPSREASIRQRRRGVGPVLDTSMRVPSGDVTQTVYAAKVGGGQVAVIEVANQSPVPVALALALRPYGCAGPVGKLPASRHSKTEVDIAGWRLSLPRPPNESGFSPAQDLWAVVQDGGLLDWEAHGASDDASFPNGLVMYPLPHGTNLRFCLSRQDLPVKLDAVPGPDNVAKGWTAVVDSGARFEFPDPGFTALAGAARARLLLADPNLDPSLADWSTMAEVMAGLAESGHGELPARWLNTLAEAPVVKLMFDDDPQVVANFVESVARTAVVVGEPDTALSLLEILAHLTKHLESIEAAEGADPWAVAAAGLVCLVDRLGQSEASVELRDRMVGRPVSGRQAVGHEQLADLAQRAHSSGRWPSPAKLNRFLDGAGADDDGAGGDDVVEASRFWRAARALLFSEVVDAESPTIELLPEFPASWRGGSVEVHNARTLFGSLSFAIRWHGARPALLWDQAAGNSTLICPALDPEWRTSSSKGEALLAGAAEGLVDIPGPGDSFA